MTSELPNKAVAVNPTLLRTITKAFWADYCYYLTSLEYLRSKGLRKFNVNNSVLATYSRFRLIVDMVSESVTVVYVRMQISAGLKNFIGGRLCA